MYNYFVKKLVRNSFDLVNRGQFDELLKSARPDVKHSFAGDHALGGIRNDRNAFKLWLQRLGRVMPGLFIQVENILVSGWPANTLAIVRWKATATLPNGERYLNKGVHFINIKWGKVSEIDVYEDTLAVFNGLNEQYNSGIIEAKAAQITS